MPLLASIWLGPLLQTCFFSVIVGDVKHIDFSSADEIAKQVLTCKNVTAISLAVFSAQDNTHITRQYGYANLTSNETLLEDTLFGIGSLTKAFTATLLGKLLYDSNLSFDTPVSDILGKSFKFNDELLTKYATVRDLLAHRTGVADYNYIRMKANFSRSNLLRKMKNFKRIGQFRNSFIYNNIMYCLLTYVTEELGGDIWENLMQKHIFNELNMTSTTFTHVIKQRMRDRMAVPYLRDKDGKWKAVNYEVHSQWGKIGGSGSIVSNAADMMQWMKFQLNTLSFEARKRLKIDSSYLTAIDETHVGVVPLLYSHSHVKPYTKETYAWTSYGLGWVNALYRGFPIIVSAGKSWGYTAEITLIPHLRTGIYVSTTGSDEHYAGRRALHLHIMDLLMGVGEWDFMLTKANVCDFMKPVDHPKNSQLEIMQNISYLYDGTYWNHIFGYIEVYFNFTTRKLQMKYGTLGLWELEPNGNLNIFNAYGINCIPSFNIRITFLSHEGYNNKKTTMLVTNLVEDEPQTFNRANMKKTTKITSLLEDGPQTLKRAYSAAAYEFKMSGQKSCSCVYDSLLNMSLCIMLAHWFVCTHINCQ